MMHPAGYYANLDEERVAISNAVVKSIIGLFDFLPLFWKIIVTVSCSSLLKALDSINQISPEIQRLAMNHNRESPVGSGLPVVHKLKSLYLSISKHLIEDIAIANAIIPAVFSFIDISSTLLIKALTLLFEAFALMKRGYYYNRLMNKGEALYICEQMQNSILTAKYRINKDREMNCKKARDPNSSSQAVSLEQTGAYRIETRNLEPLKNLWQLAALATIGPTLHEGVERERELIQKWVSHGTKQHGGDGTYANVSLKYYGVIDGDKHSKLLNASAFGTKRQMIKNASAQNSDQI
ncbi:unnamed protein product [Leptidea sinapis]|uniref:Uncharacterized protein n=1 Tax=Leptidea sinapis TaxID=189913 RepID=A0A5E4Q377_9NEOP|nr:unnamed protein product [Leptidea sinapis]